MNEVSLAEAGTRRADDHVLRVTDGTLTLDDMLGFLAAAGHSGVLHVHADRSGSFTFDGGHVVASTVDGASDVHDLVRRRTGCDLDHESVSGAYEHDMVDAAILEHTVDVLLELEIATDGAATLEFADAAPAGMHGEGTRPAAGIDVADLLAAKQSRVREWKAIAVAMPPAAAVLRVVADLPPSGVMVRPDDWRVLGALRGGGTVAHVVRVAGIGAFSACRSLRHLLDAGAVVVETLPVEPNPAPTPTDAQRVEPAAHEGAATDKGTS